MRERSLKRTSKRELSCKLTPEETVGVAQSLAHAVVEQRRVENEHEVAKKKMKDEAADVDARCSALMEKLRTGEEPRQVVVEEWYDFGAGSVQLVRTDTGEMFSERPMTPQERQLTLVPTEEPPAEPEADGEVEEGAPAQALLPSGNEQEPIDVVWTDEDDDPFGEK